MKLKLWRKYLAAFALILGSYPGFTQCPPSASMWMSEILAIEDQESLPPVKIRQLEQLEVRYLKCFPQKDSVYARIIHRLGDLYRLTGDFNKGIHYAQQAISINRTHQPFAQEAYLTNSYFNLGLYYNLLSLFEESQLYYDSCITIGLKYPGKNDIALEAIGLKAFSYYTTGDYQRSVENAQKGLLLAQNLQLPEYEANLRIQKAQSQLELKQIQEAENNIRIAIQILSGREKKLRYPADQERLQEFLATSFSVYANLLRIKKKFKESIRYYQKAYDLNFRVNNLFQCPKDLADLGVMYDKDLHEPTQALLHYDKSLKFLQKTTDAYQRAVVYNNIGTVYWRQQRYSQAFQYYQKGLDELKSDVPIRSNKLVPAVSTLGAHENLLITLLGNQGESLLGMFKKEKQNKQYLMAALANFKAADKAVDRMRWQQSAVQSKLFWREQTKKMYEKALETCYLLQDMENAFFFLEKSRAVLLKDKISELGAQQYIPRDVILKEQRLRIQLFSLQQQQNSLKETDPQFQQVSLQWFRIQEQLERFIKSLEKSYPTYYRYKYDTTGNSISFVRSHLLKKDQSFLEYFTGDSLIYILIIKPKAITFSQVDGKNYHAKANELLRLCADKALLNSNYKRYRQLAQELYATFFQPLAIQTKRVIISPDDYFIPFEILLTDKTNPASFLLEKHAISYTYSADFLKKENQEKTNAPPALLGVAPIQYQPYLQQQPLTGADLSLNIIKSYFPSTKVLEQKAATKSAFLKNLSSHAIVHLYSHAEADSSDAEPLLYLQDSVLRLSELQLLDRLPTQLIVLSACNTATGKNVRGEGVFSLARGFAAVGIPASITTLWQVDNQTTYQLAELFYKSLSQGHPSDAALREAKLAFLRTHDKTSELPYYWAASILIGQSDQFAKQPDYTGKIVFFIITGLLLFLITISVLRFQKRKVH